MPLISGTRLGPYEIQSSVGAGGMGEVYRARDTRLNRTVAIKILPPAVSSDPDRLPLSARGPHPEPSDAMEPRKEPNFSYRLFRAIYPVFRLLFPNQVIRADDLARAMVDVAVWRTGERGGLVFENRDIRAMVEFLHPRAEDSPGENGSQKTPR